METLSLAELEQHDPGGPIRGRERRFLCPLPACADKQNPRQHRAIALNTETGAYICHRCRATGKIRERWTDARPVRPRSSRERAHACFQMRPTPASGPAPVSDMAGVPIAEASAGLAYLAGRGIPASLATAAGLRFSATWSPAGPAVLFPMQDEQGAVLAVHGRAIRGPGKLTRGPKNATLFLSPGARAVGTIAITEGPMDALALALCGLPAMAMVGTSAPDWLRRHGYGRTVLLATDADSSGEAAALRLWQDLCSLGARVARLMPPAGCKDWNEALARAGELAVRSSLTDHAGLLPLEWLDARDLADLRMALV